jgi:predicted dehydrogenase
LRNVFLYGEKLGAGLFPLEYYDAHGVCAASSSPVAPADIPEDPYRIEVENFIHACQGQEKLLVTAQQGVYVQRVIDAFYRSAENHMPIYMNSALSNQ